MKISESIYLRVGLARVNSVVADLKGNTNNIIDYIRKAKALKVDLLIYPELALTVSPPQCIFSKILLLSYTITRYYNIKEIGK